MLPFVFPLLVCLYPYFLTRRSHAFCVDQERERQRQRVEAANLKYSSKAAEGSLKGDALLALVAPVPAATDPADVETGHGGRDGVVPTIAPKMVENNAFDAVVPTDGAADNQAATAAAAVVGGGGGTVNTKDDACIEDCAKEDDEEDDEDDDEDEDEEDNDDDVTFFRFVTFTFGWLML
jgi:hypothetical protein